MFATLRLDRRDRLPVVAAVRGMAVPGGGAGLDDWPAVAISDRPAVRVKPGAASPVSFSQASGTGAKAS